MEEQFQTYVAGFDQIEKPKPFKLCFIDKNVLGRSNVKIGKPLNLPSVVSLKFYKPEPVDDKLVDKYLTILKKGQHLDRKGPIITENQKYGLYHDIRLTDADPKDQRLNYHKRTDILIKEHLMNYEKIRD